MSSKMIEFTNDELVFLKELAHELKTQDRQCTGKPIFFQIREKKNIVGLDPDYAQDFVLLIGDEYEEFYNVPDAKEFLIEYYEFSEDVFESVSSLERLGEILDERGIQSIYTGYATNHEYKNCFLTKKALDAHVKQNHYHYEKNDYFINHAWRNPELERLLQIVEKFADID